MIKSISVEQTYPLRNLVLRPGLPVESCHLDRDKDPQSFHLGFFKDNEIVGIISFMKESFPDFDSKQQYRLRAMATHPDFRNQGIGSQLNQAGETLLIEKKCTLVWCHAREAAYDFYGKCGYQAHGEVFHIPNIGPHLIYFKPLAIM